MAQSKPFSDHAVDIMAWSHIANEMWLPDDILNWVVVERRACCTDIWMILSFCADGFISKKLIKFHFNDCWGMQDILASQGSQSALLDISAPSRNVLYLHVTTSSILLFVFKLLSCSLDVTAKAYHIVPILNYTLSGHAPMFLCGSARIVSKDLLAHLFH